MAANKYVALIGGKLKEVFASVTGTANAIPAGDATGRLDISWMPIGVGAEVVVLPSSEALSAGDMINIWDDAGTIKIRKADASAVATIAHGFVTAGYLSGATVTAYLLGVSNSSVSGLTPGARYFLSETAGAVTVTPPTTAGAIVQELGVATDAANLLTFNNINSIEVA